MSTVEFDTCHVHLNICCNVLLRLKLNRPDLTRDTIHKDGIIRAYETKEGYILLYTVLVFNTLYTLDQ